MRRIRAKEKQEEKVSVHFLDSKKNILVAGIIVAVLIIISGVLIYMENNDNKIVVKNGTDLKLESLVAYYRDQEDQINEGITVTGLNAGESVSFPTEEINLYNQEANLEIRFNFENHEAMLVDAGIFNDVFNGKVSINFVPVGDNKVEIRVKAKSGVINSSRINCDEVYTINLNEDYIED
jgi:hypothetical protein